MAIVVGKSNYKDGGFSLIDNDVIKCSKLGSNAFRVWCLYGSWKDGLELKDSVVCKTLNISQSTLTRIKAELENFDLIKQVRHSRYVYYVIVGDATRPASKVWKAYEAVMNNDSAETFLKKYCKGNDE